MLSVNNYSPTSNINFTGISKKADYHRVACPMCQEQREEYKVDIEKNAKKVATRAAKEQERAQKMYERTFKIIEKERNDEFYDNLVGKNSIIVFKDDYDSDLTLMSEIGEDGLIKRVTAFDRSFIPEEIKSITEYDNGMRTTAKFSNAQLDAIEKTTMRSPHYNREVSMFNNGILTSYFLTQGSHQIHMEYDIKTGEMVKGSAI